MLEKDMDSTECVTVFRFHVLFSNRPTFSHRHKRSNDPQVNAEIRKLVISTQLSV